MKEAAERCQEKQLQNRGHFRRALLADRDANELQGFANDIKEAVTIFKVSYCLPYPASVLTSAHVIGQQTSAEVQQMIQQFVSVYFWNSIYEV